MRLASLLAVVLAASAVDAQPESQPVRATTEDGRAILVYADGTWRLDRSAPSPGPPPPAPPPPPPPASVELRTLESASGRYSIEFDPSKWSRTASTNPASEFELALPFSAAAALTIYEAFPMTDKELRDVVIANARAASTGFQVLSERSVRVPGGSGIQVEFEGVAENGVRFLFITSVFGDDEGALQVTTYTSASNRDRQRPEMLRFHEGVRLLGKRAE